ncbi:3-oxoacyl-reductase [Phyllosticta capitalensis]|uniref:3-oxoacyl-reductase n=1 Tax=Phyllosticta capitalensis TaxID=121624 RepID=UPI00312EF474
MAPPTNIQQIMPTAVVTGANSGIGFEFSKVLIKQGYDVYAVDVQEGENLKSLGCRTARLDVSSPEAVADFKENRYGDGPLDLLLNIAGVIAPKERDSLTTVDHHSLLSVFSVNTFGPLLLTQALLPNLLKSKNPRIGLMSSRMGSIADNTSGGTYAYRSSKAALNSIGKSMAVDLKDKGVFVAILHPGMVRTGLVPQDSQQLKETVNPDEAAQKLFKVFMSKKIEDTGKFWHREGQELPW